MNLADAIRQATLKAPEPETGPMIPAAEVASEALLDKLSEVDNVVFEEPAKLPDPPAPQVFGGNVVRLELFLTPEQLNSLFRVAIANHHSMMTLREAAAYLRINANTLETMARDGKIPSVLIDGKWRFLKASIDEWVTMQSYNAEVRHDAA
jgi:excisionase family DNA binding protein